MGVILMKGNEAIGESAIIAGCRHYFGYPITPQNELPAYMAARLAEGGRHIPAGGERSGGHQHGVRRLRRRRARHDLLLVTRA